MTTQPSEDSTPFSIEAVSDLIFPLTTAEEQEIFYIKGPPYERAEIHKLILFNGALASSHRYLALHVSSGFTRITATEYYAAAGKLDARANLFTLYQESRKHIAPINDHRPST